MANTRSASRASAKVAKVAKVAKKPQKKVEKKVEEEKVEEEKVEEEKVEEEDFQLPSDSDDDSEESDTELAIHNHIISSGKEDAAAGAETQVSMQGGHTVIKPATGKAGGASTDKAAADTGKGRRGVIYIGRLPNGFEEKELRKYFQQFGEITRLRVSRNKKTGQSKHYAFLEFKDAEVAKIAAETMDNYLLMGHLLRVSVMAPDKIHEKLFVGANIKFKVVPYGKINQLRHDKKKPKAEWEKLNKNHLNSIKSKQETLAAKGIDFDISAL